MAIVPDNSYISPRRMMNGVEIIAKALKRFTDWDFRFGTPSRIGDREWTTTFTAPDGTQWIMEIRPLEAGKRSE